MHVGSLWAQILWAIAGGVIAEVLHWYLLSRKPEGIGSYLPKPAYWVFTVFMVGLGGLMPVFYLSGDASVILCVQLGATAPIALQKLFSAVPAVVQHQGPEEQALGEDRPQSTFKDFLVW